MTFSALGGFSEFDDHHVVSSIFDREAGLCGFIAVHRTHNGHPSLGATRFWEYESDDGALKDALRLSRLMSYKAAIAGLPYGGAKAVIIRPKSFSEKNREQLFRAYARKIDFLGGKFVTGTDVGVTDDDVKIMHTETEHVIGTKVDPAYYTGVSVISALEASFEYLTKSKDLSGKTFAIQGVGKTGLATLRHLSPIAEKIFVADINKDHLKRVAEEFPKVTVVSPDEIHKQEVDAFVPCALGGVLNSKVVSELKCKVVAGSANNQLADEYIDDVLAKLGILYAPDYATNAGGLIAVADEMESSEPSKDRILEKIAGVQKTLSVIFATSEEKGVGTNNVANSIAEHIFNAQT